MWDSNLCEIVNVLENSIVGRLLTVEYELIQFCVVAHWNILSASFPTSQREEFTKFFWVRLLRALFEEFCEIWFKENSPVFLDNLGLCYSLCTYCSILGHQKPFSHEQKNKL